MTKKNATATSTDKQVALIDHDEFIKGIVREALQSFLEAEMTEFIGAGHYERSELRSGMRNGYKPRTLKMKVGTIELSVPQSRDGSFSTELFSRFQRSERSFILAMMQMYQSGVSTRKVTDITEALCGTSFSASTVSALCRELDEQVLAWKKRDLGAQSYPYLFVDATYQDTRVAHSVVSQGVLIVTGVRSDGQREILDTVLADTESEATYNDLFSDLKKRGLSGVRLVVSDDHQGLKNAISRYFQGAAWQRCQVHFSRNAMGKVARRHRKELAADIARIFAADKREDALELAGQVADSWKEVAPQVAVMLEEDVEQCLTILSFPAEHRRRLRTNNAIERFNEEIKRRTRVIRIFPNRASALRLIASLCIEQSEEWLTGRRYLDMELLEQQDRACEPRMASVGREKLRKVS